MVTSSDIRIRISNYQKQQLKQLSESQGFKTISDYVRSKVFSDLSIHDKLNKILFIVGEKDDRGKTIK